MAATAPRKIERFEIQRVLGAGAQGTVYLARDPRLGREVAIKTLAVAGEGAEHRGRVDALLAEARIVGQLSHPNIVPLFDAGEDDGVPYLVFEYVQGRVLSDLLSDGRPMPVKRAVDIIIQVLKAVGFAHQKGVAHRDVKPGNIMLAGEDVARVMDFGIAQLIPAEAPQDLLSIAMVLYQMLTGQALAPGAVVARASQVNEKLDQRLDALLGKAFAQDPKERFESAADMENALYLYLNPEPETDGADAGGTLGFLLRRMRHKSDFPALSATITAINKATVTEEGASTVLSDSILKDFALTNKLLKMVNTAHFGHFGGTISTISKAVVIIGFDGIRGAAITLMLFEHLQNKAQAAHLKDELVASYFSGILARQLASKAGVRNSEEAFICATFHNLGRLLTSFYFPEESREIENLIQQKDMKESQASFQVLGVSFEELGIGIAKTWNFPPRLIQSMRQVRDDRVAKPANDEEKLRALSGFSAGACDAMRESSDAGRAEKLNKLVGKFGEGLGINAQVLATTIKESTAELARDAAVLNLKVKDSAFLAGAAKSGDKYAQADSLQSALSETTLEQGHNPDGAPEDPKRKSMLFDGIQDVTNTLMGEFKLNEILRKILSTMYSSMGFTRVLLYVRDTASNSLKSRFGFGADVEKIVNGKFAISLADHKDVFQAAVAKGADVFVDNINAESIRRHIPELYRKSIPARSFALFPIVVKGKPIGLFYGDSDVEGSIRFSTEELTMLKTLRNQAVLAIKQSA